MDTSQKVAILKQTDLFNFYDDRILEQVAENCRQITLDSDEILFHEGTLENAMYLILSGKLLVFKGMKQINELGPSQYLGEMSLIECKPRSASAKAIEETTVLEINEEQFNTYLASEPKSLLAMMRTLSSRIRGDLDKMMVEMQNLSIFTHDIKNNLTPMGLAEANLEELIEDFVGRRPGQVEREATEDLRECFGALQTVRENLVSLINSSLNHVKKIKVNYVKDRGPLLPVIQQTVRGIACHKYLTGKKIDIKSNGSIPESVFNPLDIQRVVQNMVINAGCVTEEGGKVDIVVKGVNGSIQVSVVDHGPGIPEEIRPYLLKESFTTKEDGNGLGLLSCKQIIEDHHQGRFWYDTEIGKGTAFHFTIPITD